MPDGEFWYQSEGVKALTITPEEIGHLQNKGWDKKEPAIVAIEAARAHRAAESKLGVAADQILKLPKDMTDKDGMRPVWERLGAPKEAKDYDFSSIEKKGADGAVANAKLLDALRATSADLMLPKDHAAQIAAGVQKHLDQVETDTLADKTAALATEKAELAKNWGANAEANKFIATQAVQKLAVSMNKTPQEMAKAITALEGVVGYKPVMEMFLAIGQKIGEDKFVRSDGVTPGVMTVDQAKAEKQTLMADKEFGAKLLAGNAEAKKKMLALNTIIVGAAA